MERPIRSLPAIRDLLLEVADDLEKHLPKTDPLDDSVFQVRLRYVKDEVISATGWLIAAIAVKPEEKNEGGQDV